MSLLAVVTGSLVPARGVPGSELTEARRALARSLLSGQTELSAAERGGDVNSPAAETLPPEVLAEIRRVAEEAVGSEPGDRTRVVRREVPVLTSQIAESVPMRASGWAVERTYGPFLGADGRRFWLDVRRIVRHVPIVEAATGRTIGSFSHIGPLPNSSTIRIAGGSVWLTAAPFDDASPAGSYFGVRVTGGVLGLSSPPLLAGGTVRVSPGTLIRLELALDVPQDPPPPATGNGGEVRRTKVRLPSEVALGIGVGGSGKLTSAKSGEVGLYGERLRFRPKVGVAPRYEAALNRMLFPFEVTPGSFRALHSRSRIFRVSGDAPVDEGAWALPVALPSDGDAGNLGPVAGPGAMVFSVAPGLIATLPELAADRDVALGRTFFLTEPGRLGVTATAARATARQTLALWTEADGERRSRVELVAGSPITVRYNATTVGDGAEMVQVDGLRCSTRLDRPVTAAGTCVPFFSDNATLTLARYQRQTQLTLDAGAEAPNDPITGRPVPLAPMAFALRNALLRVTGTGALKLTGILSGGGTLDSGNLAFRFGLTFLLPTLPDPYASNLDVSFRRFESLSEGRSPYIVLAEVSWTHPQRPMVSFALWPRSPTASFRPETTLQVSAPLHDARPSRPLHEDDEARLGRLEGLFRQLTGLGPDSFRLLDVSSRADQFGVGYGFASHRRNQGQLPPLRLRDMDLVMAGQNLAVFTLPAFQWEPVYNIPNPEINEKFPNNLYSDTDGGPTRVGVPTATLVPVAPIPAISTFVGEFNRAEDPPPMAVRFTLPFGAVAVAELRHNRRGAPLFLVEPGVQNIRPRFVSADLTGGRQIGLTPPVDELRSGAPPSFAGATIQLRNGHERFDFNVSNFKSVLGDKVDPIFNAEFGPGSQRSRVPVSRIDISGYGASIFSDWRHPQTEPPGISQARFDATIGRTAYEVVQAKSLMYPWGVVVVRTITLQRTGSGGVFRRDSGWQAASDGEYRLGAGIVVHPGVVPRLTNVRRIRDTSIDYERVYPAFDPHNSEPTKEQRVRLTQVLFDADVVIENATLGVNDEARVPVRDLVGYVQLEPVGRTLIREQLSDMLEKTGPVGGAIDCELNVGRSGLHMRLSRIEVDHTATLAGNPQFVAVARGTIELPSVGQWSFAYQGPGETQPHRLDADQPIPLIRTNPTGGATPPYRFADAAELHRVTNPHSEYGLVHSTGAQRLLVPQPQVRSNDRTIHGGSSLLFADMYTLAGGVALFPRPDVCHPLPAGSSLRITGRKRMRLDVPLQPGLGPGEFKVSVLERTLSKASALGVRSRFRNDATIKLVIDSDQRPDWSCTFGPVAALGDIGDFDELLQVVGEMSSSSEAAPGLRAPQMVFGGALSPVQAIIDLLTSFGLPFPFFVSVTNTTYTFKSGAKYSFPPPGLGELIDDAIKHGLGVMLHLELLTGFGKEGESAGEAAQGAISDGGIWHFYLEFSSKLLSEVLRPIPAFVGGASKFEVAARSQGKAVVTFYWGVAGAIEVEVKAGPFAKLIKVAGERAYSAVFQPGIAQAKVGLGISSEWEVEGSLLDGLAAVKLAFELLVLAEKAQDYEFTGEATLGVDVTLGWVFNKTFEVELEVDEEIAAAAFVAATVLP